ncbi:MAG: TonB-dependent receptor [Acidobacteria bacterium]|nr:TonB-dependent receptor [Acidobacteriota bacterium]
MKSVNTAKSESRLLFSFGRVWGTLAIALVISLTALAQQDLAKLEGVVKDPTGALIPGATVTIRSEVLSVTRTATTNSEGIYVFPQLRPGTYQVIVEANGFNKAQVTDLVLGVGQTRSLDIEMKAGNVAEQVNIVASETVATLDSSSNRLGANVTAKEVAELPVNGRNFSQLQLLTPGATNAGSGNFNEIRFNARSNQQNGYKLDGVEASAIWDASPGYLTVQGSQFRLQTSLENIQEFRVDSSNYPAEYGTGTGGQITVIGKSGSNDFHGGVFDFVRNDKFDARNFFDGNDKSKLRLNQFGGSLGGRIVRDRLFFFGSYEGLRQRAGFNIIESTPSDFVRDFINFYGTADQRGEDARAALGISAADAQAGLTRIQALRATGAINAFPIGSGARSNVGGLNQSAQLVFANRVAQLDEDAFSIRLDGKFNERFNGYVRYQRNTGELLSPDGLTGRTLVANQKPDNFVAAVTQIYGTKIINETKFGINRAESGLQTSFPAVSGSNIDFSKSAFILTGGIVQPGVNGGAATGFSSPGGLTRQSSAGNGRAQPIRPASYSFIDNLNYTEGNHAMKFGFEARLVHVDFDQLGGTQYSYGSLRDFALNQNLTAAFIGDMSAPGGFRVATNPITTITRDGDGFHRARQHYLIGYAQDEWKLRPNFTLNYGLRYEYYSPVKEQDGRAIVVDAVTGQFRDSKAPYYQASRNGFGPRLAFAWSPEVFKGKTVIRAGGGLYYGPGQFEDLIQPIESNVLRSTTSFATGIDSTVPGRVSAVTAPVTNFAPRVYDINGYNVPERVTQYGLSIQQELPGKAVLTLAYVGSQGRNLFQRNIANVILPGTATVASGQALPSGAGIVNVTDANGRVIAVRQIRQFSLINKALDSNGNVVDSVGNVLAPFGEMDYKTSGGRDNFNAFQAMINRRFAAGLTLGAHYQWSHSIGTTQGSNEAQTAQDPFNFNGERGNNTFDIRHNGNINVLYELPFGKGKAWKLNGLADTLLGGWTVGNIYNFRTGTPLDIRITRPDVVIQCRNSAGCQDGSTLFPNGFVRPLPGTINATSPLPNGFVAVINTPGGNNTRNTRRPDRVAGVDPYITVGNLRYLNPAAFTIPQPGTYGNLSRGALYGPSFHQFDLTLQKRFNITEKIKFEFRAEMYNLFNRANFANPPAILPNNLGNALTSQQPGQPFRYASETDNNVGNFGLINGTVSRTVGLGTNRQIQFSGRISF